MNFSLHTHVWCQDFSSRQSSSKRCLVAFIHFCHVTIESYVSTYATHHLTRTLFTQFRFWRWENGVVFIEFSAKVTNYSHSTAFQKSVHQSTYASRSFRTHPQTFRTSRPFEHSFTHFNQISLQSSFNSTDIPFTHDVTRLHHYSCDFPTVTWRQIPLQCIKSKQKELINHKQKTRSRTEPQKRKIVKRSNNRTTKKKSFCRSSGHGNKRLHYLPHE
jgi:hypothetical protein